ncbi:MAG: hypothetical protein FWF02_00140 [Micrococcales bacterium]|nr:hypothetical protein [Micrococcales bacterium]MCL2666108.1 hypothetical protein [Micrococcales bacterium]
MPLFELGSGRVRLVQPMQPRASTFTAEVRAVVTHNLQAVVPEPLFVVHEHDGREGSGLPDLLALDPTGRPVTIEVVHQLDHDAFLSALRRAGTAGRMTETDFGQVYQPTDPSRFARDFNTFRAGLPFGIQAPHRAGPRIVVLCADIAPEAHDAADFWQARGGRLDILQVGVVIGEDETRLLAIGPYATHESRRRMPEPTGLRLVHGGMFEPDITSAQPIVEEHRAAVNDDVRPTPPLSPAVAQTMPRPRTDSSWSAAGKDSSWSSGKDSSWSSGGSDSSWSSGDSSWSSSKSRPTAREPEPARTALAEPPRSADSSSFEPLGPAEPAVLRKLDILAAPLGLPPALDDRPHLARTSTVAYPELVELVNEVGPTQLVWLRRRRGERIIARLRIDGLIELPDGRRFDDPSAAASAAARSEGEFDGWTSWRLGDHGPTLAEAIQERHPF